MTFRHRTGRVGIAAVAVLTALLLLWLPSPGAGAQDDARAALARGERALEAGDARTARVELMNAIKADPKLAAARLAQARTLLALGDGASALAELDRAEALGVPAGELRAMRAHAWLQQRQPEKALMEARAVDVQAAPPIYLARMEGQALQALGRMGEAVQVFDYALSISPRDAQLWADIARLNRATGDLAAAIDATDRAASFGPDDPAILTLRAVMVRDQYGLRAALPLFAEALARDRNYVPALLEYGATLLDMGKASQALGLTRRALAISPGEPRAFYIQAIMAARAYRYDLARGLLVHTNGRLDGLPGMRLLRGVLHLQAGNPTLAAQELSALVEAQPLNIRARLLLARAHYDDGQYEAAESVLFPIVERADAGSYALTLAGRIHEALGDRATAESFLERAGLMAPGPATEFRGAGSPDRTQRDIADQPGAIAPKLRHIRALLQVGDGDAAIAHARKLADRHGGDPDALIVLGDALLAEGRAAQAAAAYEESANLRFREDVALRLADAWQRAGEQDRARRALGLLLAQYPMSIDGQRLAAAALLAEKRYDRALPLLFSLRARLGNEDVLLMADLARARIGKGTPGKALPYAAHAWRLQPMNPVAADIFGWTLFKARGGNAASVELLEKAAQLAPQEPLVKTHLKAAQAALRKP